MKINTTVDIGWIGTDGELEEKIRREVIENVVNRIIDSMDKFTLQVIENSIKKYAEEKVQSEINKLADQFLTKEVNITDSYGDVIFTGKIIDLIKKRFDEFWEKKVDKNFKQSTSYSSQPFYVQLIRREVDKLCEPFANRMATEVRKQVKEIMSDKLKLALGDEIVNKIGIPALVDRISNRSLPTGK